MLRKILGSSNRDDPMLYEAAYMQKSREVLEAQLAAARYRSLYSDLHRRFGVLGTENISRVLRQHYDGMEACGVDLECKFDERGTPHPVAPHLS